MCVWCAQMEMEAGSTQPGSESSRAGVTCLFCVALIQGVVWGETWEKKRATHRVSFLSGERVGSWDPGSLLPGHTSRKGHLRLCSSLETMAF